MTDPSTTAADGPAPDPGNSDPADLVAALDPDDDAPALLAQLLTQPDDDPLGY